MTYLYLQWQSAASTYRRRCLRCPTILRQSNKSDYCAVCNRAKENKSL